MRSKREEGRATPENIRVRENLLSTAGVISIHRFINTLVTWHRLQELSFYSLQIFKVIRHDLTRPWDCGSNFFK